MIVADNPVFGFDYASSLDITNLAIGLDRVTAPDAGGPTGAGVGVAVVGQRRRDDVTGPREQPDRRLEGLRQQQDAPVRRRRSRHVRRRAHRRRRHRLTAARPGRLRRRRSSAASPPPPTSSASRCSTPPARAAPPPSWPPCCGRSPDKDEYDIKVLNLSIGGNVAAPTEYDPIAMAVEFAWKRGITVVCAAGNEGEFGPGGITSPATSPLRDHRRRERHRSDGEHRRTTS